MSLAELVYDPYAYELHHDPYPTYRRGEGEAPRRPHRGTPPPARASSSSARSYSPTSGTVGTPMSAAVALGKNPS